MIDYKETKLKEILKLPKKVNIGTHTVDTPFHLELISISTYKSIVKILFFDGDQSNLLSKVVILIRHTFANILINCCMFDPHAKL